MPLTDELEEQIKGDVGDIKNSGGRGNGGAITAALFLQHFDEGLPWAHLDIAGCNRTGETVGLHPEGRDRLGRPHAGRVPDRTARRTGVMAVSLDGIRGAVDEIMPGVVADRRWLHQHPELGYQEFETAKFVAERLRAMGIEDIRTGVGGTGVTGVIRGGLGEGKVVGLRADMDALPILEENEVDYVSLNPGTMHACGHDGHVSMLLGTARMLNERKDQFAGSVKLFFQPAEEGGNGAGAMIRDGALDDLKPDAMFGIHLWNTYPVGTVKARVGPMMVGADGFTITIHGQWRPRRAAEPLHRPDHDRRAGHYRAPDGRLPDQ